MSVSHDGHARFARQESGQVFANGSEQNPIRFQKWRQVYRYQVGQKPHDINP